MSKTADDATPGALRLALFQDVPHIIDTMWHWAEFYGNRRGVAGFTAPYRYQMRPAWKLPVFMMFVWVSAFLVFGPTADSLCLATGESGMALLRALLATASWVTIFLLFLGVLNRATFELALGAEGASALYSRDDPILVRLRQKVDAMRREWQEQLQRWTLLSSSHAMLISNLMRVLVASVFLPRVTRVATVLAGIFLALGTAVLLTPLAFIAHTLTAGGHATGSCNDGDAVPLLWQGAALFACIAIVAWAWRRWTASLVQFLVSILLWGLVIAVLWGYAAPPQPSEAAGGPYPHVYALSLAIFLLVALLARLIAIGVTRSVPDADRKQLKAGLRQTELLTYSRDWPDVAPIRLWGALINGVAQHLVVWLLLPAFAVFVASGEYVWGVPVVRLVALFFIVVSSVLITYGHLSTHWVQMLTLVERWFLNGTARVVSYAVILIAILRLASVQYVTTILDATPAGVLFVIVIMTYLGVWYYEYWINRWLGECLLALLSSTRKGRRGWIRRDLEAPASFTWAAREGRVLALHGTGWFCAQGHFFRQRRAQGERSPEFAFTLYGYDELFSAIDRSDGARAAHDIRRRVRLYFNLVNMLLMALVGILAWWHAVATSPLDATPVVKAAALPATTRQSAHDLARQLRTPSARPLIVVAASGGGTRAAVYTAVALEGLARLGVASDIALLSGVSGGGVAAAAFAANARTLRATKPAMDAHNAWRQYVDKMGDPFIQDVLEGASELRIAGPAPLGVLLKESLDRRLFERDAKTFGQLQDIELILNTTIAGHPYGDSALLRNRIGGAGSGNITCTQPYSALAGGRLVFSNLRHTGRFPQAYGGIPDMHLPYKLVGDSGVELAAAGALTANFPPVFSNARVQITPGSGDSCASDSYLVTDGGATENLGMVSALYAIDSALDAALTPQPAEPTRVTLRPIHLVAIEASAIHYDYEEDRGVGAATGGAKERVNAGLTQLLIQHLNARLKRFDSGLHVHYLTLPVAFRSRGGFGTHWMFPNMVRIENPLLANRPGWWRRAWQRLGGAPADSINLSRDQVLTLWRGLFSSSANFCERARHAPPDWPPEQQRVGQWLCGKDESRPSLTLQPDWHVQEWARLVTALKPR